MSEKNIFIGILIVALIGTGIVLYRSYYKEGESYAPEITRTTSVPEYGTAPQPGGTTISPTTSYPISGATVVFTDAGFSPAPLTVAVGTTVTFRNDSSGDMWVASAPHPTHTDYPEFDAKQAIKPGQSYSFTFMKAGTWKYHNHLNPAKFGSIVVTQ